MKIIKPTNSDKEIKVDDADYPLLARFRWIVSDTGYALTQIRGQKHIRMHHLVYGAMPKGKLVIDHLNNDRLDNRRSNLRLCTMKDNARNRKDTIGYCFDKSRQKYIVQYRGCFYGRYDTEEEAKEAFKNAKSGKEYQKTRRKYYMLPKHISKQFGKYRVSIQVDGKLYRKVSLNSLDEALEWRDKIYKSLAKED